jgi:hypothetical protein
MLGVRGVAGEILLLFLREGFHAACSPYRNPLFRGVGRENEARRFLKHVPVE